MESKNDSFPGVTSESLRRALLDAAGAPLRAPKPPPERQEVRDLNGLLDLMRRLARGEPGLAAVELGPQGCSDLLGLIDKPRAEDTAVACERNYLRKRCDNLVAECKRLAADNKAAASSVNVVQTEVGSLRLAVESLREDLASARQDAEGFRRERNDAFAQVTRLGKDCSELKAGLVETSKQLAWVEQCRNRAQTDALKMAAQLEATNKTLSEVTAERDDLATRFADLSETLLDDDDACDGEHQEPPRHLHCCECDQCQPPPRGSIVINVLAGGQVVVG